jgi:geranylgeranyl diphosphate synthase type I
MAIDELNAPMLAAIEAELRDVIDLARGPGLEDYHFMLAYHLGWEGEGAGPEARGKRIRPLILLLACASAGGDWRHALPAAAGAELVHNFSLIHDDIQDNSSYRRGRETVWKLWGIPQAINIGDAMLALAHLGIMRLDRTAASNCAQQAARILQQACLELTRGQYLDLAFEVHQRLSTEDYWNMVEGKTAALLAASSELGALVAGSDTKRRDQYRNFGRYLGLAFQALDDILGIWGDAASTGKSAESDLLAGKKSLPVVYGLEQNGPFARRWLQGPVQEEEIASLAAQLEAEGAREFARGSAASVTERALAALADANPQGEAGEALTALASRLLHRSS